MGLNESLYTILFIVFLHFLAATNRNTDRWRTETARSHGSTAYVPSSHHSSSPQAGHSFAVRKLLLRLPYRDADGLLESWNRLSMESTLFLCTFADFYISREREKGLRVCEASSHGGKTCHILGGTADYVFFIQLFYIKKPLVLSEIWRNDC